MKAISSKRNFGRFSLGTLVAAATLKVKNKNTFSNRKLACALGAILMLGSYGIATAADVEVMLEGQGSQSGVPLTASIAIDIIDVNMITLSVTNTSPESSSTEADAPVITRIAFDVGQDEAAIALLDSTHTWEYTDKTKPFCGRKRGLLPYGIVAQKPAPHNGIKRGETGVMTLQIDSEASLTTAFFDGLEWALKFQVVGEGGEDSGCSFGNAEPVVVDNAPPVVYYESEFVASAAEVWPGLPSEFRDLDTRAGSVEINTFGGLRPNGAFPTANTDPAFEAGIVSLRTGDSGKIVEQKHVERRWPPALDTNGCSTNASLSFPQCFIWAYDRGTLPGSLDANNLLVANVPDNGAGDSNYLFDDSGNRVAVEGDLTADYSMFSAMDNGHQTMTATWTVPDDRVLREETQMLFRGRYDWNCSGLESGDEMVPLFYVNGADSNDNMQVDGVTIVEDSDTRLTITVNVQVALDAVRDAYVERGFLLEGACLAP